MIGCVIGSLLTIETGSHITCTISGVTFVFVTFGISLTSAWNRSDNIPLIKCSDFDSSVIKISSCGNSSQTSSTIGYFGSMGGSTSRTRTTELRGLLENNDFTIGPGFEDPANPDNACLSLVNC